ncbi:restriction endonuclease subunit S [Paraburkholderia aromaticivorans]|uniref:Type I restriction modification DNA specificity domain-containing protein n=1 Tax=Paraburkholderia aromaticivorans TaxID=2026199 RepID=A0A248VZL9_9BURK|nr:restriction endonuclease subunit S [Paraburkholderia aromaticivorans]ASW04444.1 hypothetical protein CJU94_40600 [Paraburkholderia aromaticivorans]
MKLAEGFQLLASAPNCVARLRELILSLAVQGKLVPQDVMDEPATSLLQKIRRERDRQISDGKIKREKALPEILEEEKPFELPKGWEWARLADLTAVLNGRAYAKHELLDAGVPVLRVGNLFTSKQWYYSDLELEVEKYCNPGDLLYAWSASFGPFIWAGPKVIYHYHIWKLDPHCDTCLNKNFLYTFLLEKTQEIKASGHGVAMIHMTKEKMEKIVVPVAPLAEQSRIVAKVDELMRLCDELESRGRLEAEQHARLTATLFEALAASESSHALAENWSRVAAHFDLLLDRPEAVDALEQTILQLAVCGLLVKQELSDEPASELLKRIQAEKDRLIADAGMRTTARLEVPEEEKYVGEVPGWQYCRLGNLARFIDYRGRTPQKVEAGVPLITAKNVRFGFISREPREYIAEKDYSAWMTRGFPRVGDLLFTTEAPLGNIALIDITERFALAQRVICFQLHDLSIGPYLRLAIMSAQVQERFSAAASGMTATGIKASRLKEIPVAIPPLAEQRRIVARVDELRRLCAALRARLTASQTCQAYFAEALVGQAALTGPVATHTADLAVAA